MNIIYMHTHDSGRFWSPYGYAVPTENIMNFAKKEAIVFRQAYCCGPTCSPSRAGFLTGQSPHANGMLGLAHFGWKLKDYGHHMGSFLKENGFHTVLCGIQHEAARGEDIGYSEIIGSQTYNMGDTVNSMEKFDFENTEAACSFLKNDAKKLNKPFFLSMGWFNTHREYPKLNEEEEADADYVMPPFPLYDCALSRKDMAGFCASVKVIDDCFGRIMEVLQTEGLMENTMLILTTDHGIAFPKMKCTLYDTGIGVALLMKIPGKERKVKAIDALVSQVDIFPTICDALGISKPDWLEGTSLMPIIDGEKEEIREAIFSEITYHAAYEPMRCIRTNRYKYIKRFDSYDNVIPVNIDDSTCKEFLLDNGFRDERLQKEYLFDLWLDPCERINLVENEKYNSVYNELVDRLEKWMRETNDPLKATFIQVSRPDGVFTMKPFCNSARIPEYE